MSTTNSHDLNGLVAQLNAGMQNGALMPGMGLSGVTGVIGNQNTLYPSGSIVGARNHGLSMSVESATGGLSMTNGGSGMVGTGNAGFNGLGTKTDLQKRQ